MNTISSLFNWIGNLIGANPNTLTTTSKTLIGAINEVDAESVKNEREYLSSGNITQSATKTYTIVPCGTVSFVRGSSLSTATGGGVRCLKTGTVVVRGAVSFNGGTTGDLFAARFARVRSGSANEGYAYFGLASSSGYATAVVFDTVYSVQADDYIYIYGANLTAARGSISSAKLYVEYV